MSSIHTDGSFVENARQCWEPILVKDKKRGKTVNTVALCLRNGSIPDDTPWREIREFHEKQYPGYTRRLLKGLKHVDGTAVVANGAVAALNYANDLIARDRAWDKAPKLAVMQEAVLQKIALMGAEDKRDMMEEMLKASLAGEMAKWVKDTWESWKDEDGDEESIGEEEKVA